MKKFIILSYTIARMGGGQMYQYNKLKYMKTQGYNTYVFYAIPGELIISDIKNIAYCDCIEQLNIHPCVASKKDVEYVKNRILDAVGYSDEDYCIIETCNKPTSMWGEIIAREINSVCIPFIIDEKIGFIDSPTRDFFSYKRKKDELKGIKKETYEMIFESSCDVDGYRYCLPIPGNNVVQNINIDQYRALLDFAGLKICTIGNLNKEYVPELLNQVIIFAEHYSSKPILYCMIGDSPKQEDMREIESLFSNPQYPTLHLFGSMYPIPEKLLYKFDVFISSAGSARVSGDRGIPTITIDSRDHMAIGIYQYETVNTVFRQGEPKVPISEKLDFLFNHYEEIKSKLFVKPKVNFDAVFSKHLEYYNSHVNTGEYYDVLSMKLSKGKILEKIIYSIFGEKIYNRFREIVFARLQR